MTLSEAAAWLRTTESTVKQLIAEQGLPARRVGRDWRFLRAALANWLSGRSTTASVLLSQAGAFAADPDMPRMLEKIYRERGRPEVDRE
jgi:excisionase family DNA binding protein